MLPSGGAGGMNSASTPTPRKSLFFSPPGPRSPLTTQDASPAVSLSPHGGWGPQLGAQPQSPLGEEQMRSAAAGGGAATREGGKASVSPSSGRHAAAAADISPAPSPWFNALHSSSPAPPSYAAAFAADVTAGSHRAAAAAGDVDSFWWLESGSQANPTASPLFPQRPPSSSSKPSPFNASPSRRSPLPPPPFTTLEDQLRGPTPSFSPLFPATHLTSLPSESPSASIYQPPSPPPPLPSSSLHKGFPPSVFFSSGSPSPAAAPGITVADRGGSPSASQSSLLMSSPPLLMSAGLQVDASVRGSAGEAGGGGDESVIVFGFSGSEVGLVEREMAECGQVEQTEFGPGQSNWITFKFKTPAAAAAALARHGMQISHNSIIGVLPFNQSMSSMPLRFTATSKEPMPLFSPRPPSFPVATGRTQPSSSTASSVGVPLIPQQKTFFSRFVDVLYGL